MLASKLIFTIYTVKVYTRRSNQKLKTFFEQPVLYNLFLFVP